MGIFDRIRRAFGEDDAPEAGEQSARDDERTRVIADRLRAFVVEKSDGLLEPDAVDPEGHLYDAGYVDSQSSVALLAFIEGEWGVEVTEVELVGRLSSLDSLARHVRDNAREA